MNEETPMSQTEHSPQTNVTPEPPKPNAPAWKALLTTPKGKLILLVGVFVVVGGFITQQVYARPVTDGFVRTVARVVPFPALSLNGETVTLNEFLSEYDALHRYFESLDSTTVPDAVALEDAIADTLINKLAVQQLAKAEGVQLDEARVEDYYQNIVAGQESEEAFIQNLAETFEWTPQEFRERIVDSIVLALQMNEVMLAKTAQQEERAQLVRSAQERVQAGEDFALVAQDVHSGFGGIQSDLGYVKASMIPEAWATQVNALAPAEVTEVIELPEGYAMFKLEEKITAGEDTQLHLLSITVPKVTLEEVVKTYVETAKVKKYVGEE